MDKVQMFNVPKIIFGNNSIEKIGEEGKKLNAKKALIITSKSIVKNGIANKITELLKNEKINTKIFDSVGPEPSLETLRRCIEVLNEDECDLVIGVGGGSVLDVAKASATLIKNPGSVEEYLGIDKIKNLGLKKILIPTTAGTGSEVTHVSVFVNEKKEKVVMYSPYLFADLALVDPLLSITLPKKLTAETGADALGHAIESYTSLNASTITEPLSLKAIELIGKNLRNSVEDGSDIKARYNISLAATLAGIAFINAGCNLGHALALAVGGKYNIPHGLSVALTMPYAVEFNSKENSKFTIVSELLGGSEDNVSIVEEFLDNIEINRDMKYYGFKENHIKELSEITMKAQRLLLNNPRKVSYEDVENIFRKILM